MAKQVKGSSPLKKSEGKKFAIFHLEGGLGKNVAATAVAQCIKNNHPDRELIVVASWPEVFINLPFVDRIYKIGATPYFYKDYIQGKDSILFKQEPYFTTEHIHQNGKLVENWAKLHNLKYSGELPSIEFNFRQKQIAQLKYTRMGANNQPKPIMVIQSNGGPLQGQNQEYSWTRDIPKPAVQALVNHYVQQGYHVFQICRHDANVVQGAEALKDQIPNMELFALLSMSQKRILIDSSLQHAAAGLRLPSAVLWVGTSPNVFGYDMHSNFVPKVEAKYDKLPDSYLFDFGFQGSPWECPYDTDDIFDLNAIVQAVDKQ